MSDSRADVSVSDRVNIPALVKSRSIADTTGCVAKSAQQAPAHFGESNMVVYEIYVEARSVYARARLAVAVRG